MADISAKFKEFMNQSRAQAANQAVASAVAANASEPLPPQPPKGRDPRYSLQDNVLNNNDNDNDDEKNKKIAQARTESILQW